MPQSSSPNNQEQTSPSDPDLEFLRRARHGDFAAFQTLVERFQRRLYGLAWHILGQSQDAEDVVQQTFLSVLEHLDSFREESAVATWVWRIATNHALKLLRKRKGLPTVPLETSADSSDDGGHLPHPEYVAQWRDGPEELAQRAEIRQLLHQALAELKDAYRLVFVLRDVEGFSVRETAELLGLTESAVKVRLLRARLMLRERLTRVLGDETTRVFPAHDHG